MYLISAYFDDATTKKMQNFIDEVAKITGNTFIIDGKIPPHITVLEFDVKNEEEALNIFKENANSFMQGEVLFSSLGVFKKQVLYIETVLNEYLHNMSCKWDELYKELPNFTRSPYYQPFGWIPHLSLGKHLTNAQIIQAFELVLSKFEPVKGNVTRIGIAKTNPHRDLIVVNL